MVSITELIDVTAPRLVPVRWDEHCTQGHLIMEP